MANEYRVAQANLEVLLRGSASLNSAQVAQANVEVLLKPAAPAAQVAQVYVEVLRSVATASVEDGYMSMIW